MEKYVSPHLRGYAAAKKPAPVKAPNIHEKPGGNMGKPGMDGKGSSGGFGEAHASEHGTQPHPSTGVHAVHIHHHGSHVMTHTHHDGGHIESVQHSDMNAAHAKRMPTATDPTPSH